MKKISSFFRRLRQDADTLLAVLVGTTIGRLYTSSVVVVFLWGATQYISATVVIAFAACDIYVSSLAYRKAFS